MKQYPSIPRSFEEFDAYVFDKLDGSNLRFEWNRKKGFHKFGTRGRLMDQSDPVFGGAIAIFFETLSEPLSKIARDNRWDALVAFAEFYGPNSFAGTHANEPHALALFDLDVFKKGLLGPKEYLKLVGDLAIPQAKYLGRVKWTRGYIDRVRAGDVECTFEGVVGKAGTVGDITMAKAKTQKWIDKVKALYPDNAESLIES
jgi:hypothetical protein